MDDSVYQTGEIIKISEFLKSLSGHDFSSDLKSGSVKRLVFGDKGIFSLVFWSSLADKDGEHVANWVVIKEYSHVSCLLDLADLLKQFHLFGHLTIHSHKDETVIGDHATKSELVLNSQTGNFVYLRGTAQIKPFN